MSDFFYKSNAPATVAIVRDFYVQKDIFLAQLAVLGSMFGGDIAPMRDITSHYAGGVKLSASRELDSHWCRPDEYGYRSLRQQAKPPTGISREQRAAIRAEHERLRELWKEHCPPRLGTHGYWDRLNVNTGNLMLGGGIKFEHQGVAYFCIGFDIDQAQHEANVAAGKPTSGWITGAVEILPSEYAAARAAKLGERA